MTFIMDPPLLLFLGFISLKIGDWVKDKTKLPVGKTLLLISITSIMFMSTSMYLNMWWMDWFWTPFQPIATSGKDMMINSAIFSFESTNTAGLIDALAAIQIAIYPVWLYVGTKVYERYHQS